MAADLGALCDDLVAESAVLEALLEPLDTDGWRRPTPAAGWSIFDQIVHLAHFDERARRSITAPDEFRGEARAEAAEGDVVEVSTTAARARHDGPSALRWWLDERRLLVETVRPLDPSTRVPWYGPDMTIASSITARLMETWAHGVDVHDALDIPVVPSPRLRHVAFIGARAFANSFTTQGLAVPAVTVGVQLTDTDGSVWAVGPPDADETVRGSLLDFCLLTTQRRHRDDTDLVASGPNTDHWLSIAQAFAGPPGTGRLRQEGSA